MGKKDFFTCPRRAAEGHASADSPLVHDGPDKDHWRKDGTCSYDGSISPEAFIEACEKGMEIGPTDKSYKFYVEGEGFRKFYTHHLTPEQGWRFYGLRLAGKIKFGYPGHPYVRLYIPGPSTECCVKPENTPSGVCSTCDELFQRDERRVS